MVPSKARAVIIGGGVIGASVAYHLTKKGWRDVVLQLQPTMRMLAPVCVWFIG